MLLQCCTQYVSKFRKLSSATGLGKVFIPLPKKDNAKECLNLCTVALLSHASNVMLKILQTSLQQWVNQEIPDVQAGLEKAEKPENMLSTSIESYKKQGNSRNTSTASLTMLKFSTVDHNNNNNQKICGKFLKRWAHQTTLPASLETCMQVKKQQLEPDMEQWTFSKSAKDCHPVY